MQICDVLVPAWRRVVCEASLERTWKSFAFLEQSIERIRHPWELLCLFAREGKKLLIIIRSNEFWIFTVNHCLSFEQQETIKWSCTFPSHRVTNFKNYYCETKVFNSIVINYWKVNAARTEKKLLKNRDNNNYHFREYALLLCNATTCDTLTRTVVVVFILATTNVSWNFLYE